MLDSQYGEQAFNKTQASDFIDFDSIDVSGDSGFGKLSGKRLSNYISKNYIVNVKRGKGPGGSAKYNVVLTAKTTKKKPSRSPTDKRFNKRAKKPLQRFNNDTKEAARRIVQNANYEEIIDAASFFNN